MEPKHRKERQDRGSINDRLSFGLNLTQRTENKSPVSDSGSEGQEINAVKPVWAEAVKKDTGELIYIEPSSHQDASSPTRNLTNFENGNERKIVPQISRKKKKAAKKNGQVAPSENLEATSPHATNRNNVTCKLTKEILLKVMTRKHETGEHLLQAMFGIIPGRAKQTLVNNAGSNNNNSVLHQNGNNISVEDKICVRGLLPDGSALKSGEVEVGDIITAINGRNVSLKSVPMVLVALSTESHVKLNIEKPVLKVPNGTVPHPKVPPYNGTIIQLLTNQTDKLDQYNSLEGVPHAVMYLSMVRESEANSDEAKEILYKYPSRGVSSKLHQIHGLFITLGDMLHNITNSRIIGSTLMVEDELVHIGYFKWCSELLVVALPARCATQQQVKVIAEQIARLINFMFLSLNSAFSDEANHGRLDHLFNLLMFQMLTPRDKVERPFSGYPPHKEDIFLQMLPGVRWLNLPDETKLDIDSTITDLEAADFADFSDEHYEDRRPYVIIGSCLFYKGYLLSCHLPMEDLSDIAMYCNYYSLNGLSTQQAVGQLVIWREVYPTRRVQPRELPAHGYTESLGRWFLLIVGLKHSILCVLLEAGGCASPAIGIVGPDPFYVDQLRTTLLHLETLQVFNVCEDRLSTPPIPALSCVDWFFPSRKNAAESGQPPLPPSVTSSPMLNRLHGQSPARGRKQDLRPFHTPPSSSPGSTTSSTHKRNSLTLDSDNDSEATSPFPSRTNSNQSSPSLGRRSDLQRRGSDASGGSAGSSELYKGGRRLKVVPDPYNMGMMQHALKDSTSVDNYSSTKLTTGHDNTLFHYVYLDNVNGVIVSPTDSDIALLKGNIHAYVLSNFQSCCVSVRNVLLRYSKAKLRDDEDGSHVYRSDCLNTVMEHGVLFKCSPENWSDSKKQPPSIQYWVVGRLVKVSSSVHEIYVCYHDSACQNSVEMAFKLAFGAGL